MPSSIVDTQHKRAEQELVIKPFGSAIVPPSYLYDCTVLGDGSLIPVIDGTTVLSLGIEQAT
ncbi:MAG: hypothetical protein H7Z11_07020 [Verrucomicrobia bacterium]|nr:hypothetical protein [Leptolyngbya sp. ES-bin-22]